MVETLSSYEENFLKLIKNFSQKPVPNILLNGEMLKSVPLKSRIRQKFLLLLPLKFTQGLSQYRK